MTRLTARNSGNKLGAIRTYSELCGRWFPSKLEARRGEELYLSQKCGDISCLEYQPKFVLSKDPRITYKADFKYIAYEGYTVHEDVKGMMTRDCRVKVAWVKEKFGVEIKIITAKDIR